jgi:hypothetical protein
MKKDTKNSKNAALAEKYFELIGMLRNGEEDSVEELMNLWHIDGVFEFAGSPPVVGTFKGAMAINALYKNRLNSGGMKLKLDLGKAQLRDVSLGIVDTQVTHLRGKENQVIAGWRTTIGTDQNQGFDIAGSHLFTFEDGKIKNLRINISPKADQSHNQNLALKDLSIRDVGRLSLAAWPVV